MGLKNLTLAMAGVMAITSAPALMAKTGSPHSLTASTSFADVTLSWKAPHHENTLQWHNGSDYNGDQANVTDAQKGMVFYAGALFTAADLTANVGETISAVDFFQYRPVVEATVVVFENGEIVSETPADQSKFAKNTWQRVELTVPVEIKADTDYRIAVRWHAGQNADFVAIKDNGSTGANGRGDQFSTDGKKWLSTSNGAYLVTAVLANDVDEEAASYNVYRGNDMVARDITDLTVTLPAQPKGSHLYTVHSVYDNATHPSKSLAVDVLPLEHSLPDVTFGTYEVDDLDLMFDWVAPLKGGNELGWGNGTFSFSIGGTASTNTKVWIKNHFTARDLIGYVGGTMDKISVNFAENCVSAVTAWVMRDGAFVYSQAVTAEQLAAIDGSGWLTVTLDEPVAIEAGHSYTYGVYVLHTPKMHPISVTSSTTVDTKGNMFSTSSPNSTNFLNSKPSWKTLKSGGMEGNWMMTASITGAPAPLGDMAYDVYRNGAQVAQGITETSFFDTVDDLGTYTYTVVARDATGRRSSGTSRAITVNLPAAYAAPVLSDAHFDKATRIFELEWTTDKELKKWDTASYLVGFDEEMTMMWGAQYTAEELEAYKGYSITNLRFVVGEGIKDLKLGVYTKTGQALAEEAIPDGSLTPFATYSMSFDNPVAITGEQDLILAYSGTLPAGTTPIVLDGGPLQPNGARVSLTGGATWMNMGTINPSYNNYNVVISALASETAPAGARSRIEQTDALDCLTPAIVKVIDREPSLEAASYAPAKSPVFRAARPHVASFNVYRNGDLTQNTPEKKFTDKLDTYNVFTYYVTAMYSNGWESAPSASIVVTNSIDQRATAPYGLKATPAGNDLNLEWQNPAAATVLTYATGENVLGLGMTGTNPTSYVANLFKADDLKPYVGKKIDHIQFALYENTVTTAQVFVLVGENIVYTQNVPVENLVTGLNDVRLNEPFIIPADRDAGVGYAVKYPTGGHPLGMDEGAAVSGYGDLLSSSASMGYWNSIKTKFKQDHNFLIKAVLADADMELNTKNATGTTYNVYFNGTLIASGLSAEAHTITGAEDGVYHVTAVDAAGQESGESNKVLFNQTGGITDIETDANGNVAPAYDLKGVRRDNPAPGTVILRRQGNTTVKEIAK